MAPGGNTGATRDLEMVRGRVEEGASLLHSTEGMTHETVELDRLDAGRTTVSSLWVVVVVVVVVQGGESLGVASAAAVLALAVARSTPPPAIASSAAPLPMSESSSIGVAAVPEDLVAGAWWASSIAIFIVHHSGWQRR